MPSRSKYFFAPALAFLFSLASSGAALAQAGARESAVVLAYQRVGDSRSPDNNVSVKQFEANIAELSGDRYTVMSLPAILDAFASGRTVENRTVAISIDGAYRSVYDTAWPKLKAAGLPFTLFVITDPVDQGLPAYMSWDEIRELHRAGVTIGIQTASFMRVTQVSPEAFRADIERSIKSYEAALGEKPKLFAWPNGEMSRAAGRILAEAGIEAAFGYHSGPIHALSDRMEMPRFSIVGQYADKKEFDLRLETLALPVVDPQPADPLVSVSGASTFALTVHPSVGRIREINCFHSEFGPLHLTEVAERRYEAKLKQPAPAGAWRINCTIPTGGKRFRWYGMQYYTAGD